MTVVLGDVGQVLSLVLVVLGVAAMYLSALLLWGPEATRDRRWVPYALMAAGAVLILVGWAGL